MYKRFSTIGLAIALLFLESCQLQQLDSGVSLKTYQNQRFGFESIYPDTWRATPPPSNLDGQTFYHPQNPDVQISVWAGYEVPSPSSQPSVPEQNANFTTRQGLSGALTVEVGSQTSIIHLTVVEDRVSYHFEGRAPSLEFADYYRLFYDLATQYQIDRR